MDSLKRAELSLKSFKPLKMQRLGSIGLKKGAELWMLYELRIFKV